MSTNCPLCQVQSFWEVPVARRDALGACDNQEGPGHHQAEETKKQSRSLSFSFALRGCQVPRPKDSDANFDSGVV